MNAIEQKIRLIHKYLSPDLLNPKWRQINEAGSNPLVGHCYIAAETLFYLLGGKKKGWTPYVLSHHTWPEGLNEGETHWFLKHTDGTIADPSKGQFDGQEINYAAGRGSGFLTGTISKRASILMERIKNHLKEHDRS